jgi:hypothetical protein
LTRPRRFLAWLAFVAAAFNAPVAAILVDDASWLFSTCVAGLMAAAILIDDHLKRTGDLGRQDHRN